MKIALSGSAGTGKTTLARALSQELALPYFEEGMRSLLEGGLDLHSLNIEQHRQLMRDMWSAQEAQELGAVEGFVADRSSLDYAAFWLHYGLYEDREASDEFMAAMQAYAESYDHVVLLPWGVIQLQDDGVRTTNRWIQLRYQGILETCLKRFLPPAKLLVVPETGDFEVRKQFVLDAIQ